MLPRWHHSVLLNQAIRDFLSALSLGGPGTSRASSSAKSDVAAAQVDQEQLKLQVSASNESGSA